jgi:uncharacterized protein YuzE
MARELQATFRGGALLAAYLTLDTQASLKSARTERRDAGLLVDYAKDGTPLGIEITAPSQIALPVINKLLKELNQEPATKKEISAILPPLEASIS